MNGNAAQLPPASAAAQSAAAAPPAPQALAAQPQRAPATGELTPRGGSIVLCADGKYRWVYAMDLLKNPTVFLLVWKILFCILAAIFAVTALIDLIQWGGAALLNTLKFFSWFTLGMTVLVALSCYVYAMMMGGQYTVMFEMDAEGVNHVQLPQQAQRARELSDLTVLAGLASGRAAVVGAGLNAARSEMYSAFSSVRAVKACPRRGLIKVNGRLRRNQVYAAPEDFAFVLDYIRSHCENLKS